MELAKEIVDGLANIQNSNSLSEETFLQLLESIVSYICRNIDTKSKRYSFIFAQHMKVARDPIAHDCMSSTLGVAVICPSKSDLVKTAIANISCLFIEAARHDYDEESLKMFLHNEHITGQRIEKLCSVYINNKQDIQTQLELTGNSIQHIVDIDWRLHHCVKVMFLSFR